MGCINRFDWPINKMKFQYFDVTYILCAHAHIIRLKWGYGIARLNDTNNEKKQQGRKEK